LQPRFDESGHYSDIQSLFAGRDGAGRGDGGGPPGRGGMAVDDPYHYIDIDRLRHQSRVSSDYVNDVPEHAESQCCA